MNLYLTVISLVLTIVATVYILRWLYVYYFQPIPGDSISVPSTVTFAKAEPLSTMSRQTLGTNLPMTRHGAFSFLLTLNSVTPFSNQQSMFSPILSLFRTASPNVPAVVVAINRITNDVGLLFYDASNPNPLDDPFYVPITTARVKDKTAVLVQMLPDSQSSELQLAIFVDGMFVESRGIPGSYNIPTSTTMSVFSGSPGGADAEVQTVRLWTDSRGLTTADMIATAEDPLNSKYQTRT